MQLNSGEIAVRLAHQLLKMAWDSESNIMRYSRAVSLL